MWPWLVLSHVLIATVAYRYGRAHQRVTHDQEAAQRIRRERGHRNN